VVRMSNNKIGEMHNRVAIGIIIFAGFTQMALLEKCGSRLSFRTGAIMTYKNKIIYGKGGALSIVVEHCCF